MPGRHRLCSLSLLLSVPKGGSIGTKSGLLRIMNGRKAGRRPPLCILREFFSRKDLPKSGASRVTLLHLFWGRLLS